MSQKHLCKNEQGYTFVIALFVIVLIAVLGLGLMSVTSNTLNTTKHERNDQSIFYIAEAALNVKKQEVYTIVYNAYDWTREKHKNTKTEDREKVDFVKMFIDKIKDDIPSQPVSYSNFEPQFNQQPEACIKVTIESESPLTINIESTGYLLYSSPTASCPDNIVKHNRTVEQVIDVDLNLKFLTDIDGENGGGNGPNLPNLAVQTTGNIRLEGSAKIDGSAVSNSGSIYLEGSANITGAVGTSQPLDAPDWLINREKLNDRLVDTKVPEISLPEFPNSIFNALASSSYPKDFPLTNGNYAAGWNPPHSKEFLTLTEDAKLNNFSVPDGKKITIDIGDKTVNLLVENTFSIGSNATVNIKGNGKLNIFVKNSLTITGTLGTTNRDPNNINVYYAGTTIPKIDDGGSLIAASLYAEKSDLALSGGGGISGNIISGGSNVTIGGGKKPTGQYILAPNAKVSLGGDFKGVIIAQSYLGNGYGTVTYAPGIVPPPFPPSSTPDYSDPEHLITEEDLMEI
ncbi:DUF7305 domain-containing protein [Lysinibacillus parviboronicapiens]|uniref:DUF7305 domain-containing protein n=1 Tax=Lysinibacillus parviboronicapiens TaxID=436516 RepID=UPI000D3D9749|nr:hypothetical protein [Lysinibacillus parviboronicapiens]